jgi:hypothetical protein
MLYIILKYTQRGLEPVYSTSFEVWLPLFFNLISPLIADQILAEERREKNLLSLKTTGIYWPRKCNNHLLCFIICRKEASITRGILCSYCFFVLKIFSQRPIVFLYSSSYICKSNMRNKSPLSVTVLCYRTCQKHEFVSREPLS